MNEKINALILLQKVDQECEALRQIEAGAVPARQALEAQKSAFASRAQTTKKSLTDAQVRKKNLELDIDAKDQLVRKSTGELNNLKSNDAYKAILTQIEQAKKDKTAIEDEVLVLMEAIEQLQKESKDDEAKAKQGQADIDAQIADLETRVAEVRVKRAAKEAERAVQEAAVPADARARYDAIRRGRTDFEALAEIKHMTCGGCRQTLPPTVLNEVMKGKDLISCDTCSRLLYIVPKPEAAPSAAPSTPAVG